MTQLVLLLFFLTCIGITAAWIAENPGNVTMTWFDYRIDTSFAFIMLLTLITALTLAGTYIFIHRLIHAPDFFSRRRSLKTQQKGLTELTHSIVALAAADTKSAELHTRKAEKLLGRTPLTLLLSAQVARTQGDEERTQTLLEQMLGHKETEYLAARYLSESASKQQQLPKAREMAERAHALNPQGMETLLSLHIRLKEWQHAIITINKGLHKGQITRVQLTRYKGLVYAEQTLALIKEGRHEAALAVALQARKQLPTSLPVLQMAAQCYLNTRQPSKAISLLQSAWKKQPHALLAESFRTAIAALPNDKQIKLARKLASMHPTAYASHMLLAQMYAAAALWSEARAELKKALAQSETTQACKLMAEIEMGEYADYDAHGRWLSRSANAIADASWVCSSCGHATKPWDSHCPSCHSFDALEWKQRSLSFAN